MLAKDASGTKRSPISSGDVRIVAVGSHSECQVSNGLFGADRDDEQIQPLIIDINDSDYALNRAGTVGVTVLATES
ncbi:MAG: hypothetical protein M3460_30705 [Actinomycetota bacterium]|nr:hypothetical protein [Actinomycetota bacterium]